MKAKYRWIILSICLILVTILTIFVLLDRVDPIDNGVYDMLIYFESSATTYFFSYIRYFANVIGVIIASGIIAVVAFFMKKKTGLYLAGTLFLTALINQGLKFFFSRPRPVGIDLVPAEGYSFPSGHTMVAVSFYGFLMFMVLTSKLSKRAKWITNSILLFLVTGISLSRVYLGVHFFTDVIASILISTAILLATTYFAVKKKDKGPLEKEEEKPLETKPQKEEIHV